MFLDNKRGWRWRSVWIYLERCCLYNSPNEQRYKIISCQCCIKNGGMSNLQTRLHNILMLIIICRTKTTVSLLLFVAESWSIYLQPNLKTRRDQVWRGALLTSAKVTNQAARANLTRDGRMTSAMARKAINWFRTTRTVELPFIKEPCVAQVPAPWKRHSNRRRWTMMTALAAHDVTTREVRNRYSEKRELSHSVWDSPLVLPKSGSAWGFGTFALVSSSAVATRLLSWCGGIRGASFLCPPLTSKFTFVPSFSSYEKWNFLKRFISRTRGGSRK